ncbi:hypothetical protein TREMEDRAFT_61523 [Tremella mesenterica DSM 1558]|uniref:uncharacterized protein n=1 Tax=Tremella mesenterica (strain ATCC 24925 / CBS 8224 / DSM 1558 / NBRC 9311 / NRRL Y-6157 / RJB 2259-6 / UBC 559-6) TaxID=578456 RepID=UPI0003F48CE0|nr:uncharacterized protein TREMEDRAFT_61523 [Tremella mesenterica DSM 1558]EIW69759.1 hypothetical protein TREMEDRAFT_61523 [Tremella mesenterica DSM 1558]
MRSGNSHVTTTQRRPERKSTLTHEQINEWLLTNGLDVQLEAQREYIGFDRLAHDDCDILNPGTGCGMVEHTIGELTRVVGDFFLTVYPLSILQECASKDQDQNDDDDNDYQSSASSSQSGNKGESMVYKRQDERYISKHDEPQDSSDSDRLPHSLAKAYKTISLIPQMVHSNKDNILDSRAEFLNRSRLDIDIVDNDTANSLRSILEGTIKGHTPRTILEAARTQINTQRTNKTSELTGQDILTSMGFKGEQDQMTAIEIASHRLQLSALAIGYITIKAVNYSWAASDVLSVRKLEKELCEGISNDQEFTKDLIMKQS